MISPIFDNVVDEAGRHGFSQSRFRWRRVPDTLGRTGSGAAGPASPKLFFSEESSLPLTFAFCYHHHILYIISPIEFHRYVAFSFVIIDIAFVDFRQKDRSEDDRPRTAPVTSPAVAIQGYMLPSETWPETASPRKQSAWATAVQAAPSKAGSVAMQDDSPA
ncbi:hypothetical protein IF2G_04770 [Cordyceps javanica]|nr:hypothetical protein IF2G_04770 [Cordyceps javanica]